MENNLIISACGPWYTSFYILALFISFVIILYEGRKFPMLKWIFLVILTLLLFVSGTQVVHFSPADWHFLLTRFQMPEIHGRSLAGGMLLGGAGLLAGYYFLRFRQNITDAFALALPLGIAIQRAGCFLTGCCFGKVSALPWAVRYPVETLPHFHQFSDNLITRHALLSLPVHPVQLYEMAGLLAVVAILLLFRKRMAKPGNLFILSLLLISVVRLVSEFFRDVHAHTIGGEMVWIFNTTQLVLLLVILILFFFFLKKGKTTTAEKPATEIRDFSLVTTFFLLSLLFLCFSILKTGFVLPEIMVMHLAFSAAFGFLAIRVVHRWRCSQYRWVSSAGFVLPLVFMAQTFPVGQQDSVLVKTYKTIKFGMATGDFENSSTLGYGEGCDRVSNTEYFRQQYTLAGAAFEFTRQKPALHEQFTFGAKTIFGNHRETRISDLYEKNTVLLGITPYAAYDTRWVGLGGGLHLGNLTMTTENLSSEGSGIPKTGSREIKGLPHFFVRVGPRKWIFAEYRYADWFPSALPGYRQQFAVGTGLGMENGTNLRFGFNTNDITLISGTFPIQNRVVIEPMLLWGKSPNWESENTRTQFSLSVSYRFGHRETTAKK